MNVMRGIRVLLALTAAACGDDGATKTDAATDGDMVDTMGDGPDPNMPATLAETGLCMNASCTQITPGILAYTPRYQLYSDTAEKKRWLQLPAGTTINTSNMEFWEFPVGTKLWKEFIRDNVRVETRLIMRVGPGNTSADWFYAAYVWNATQDATHWAEFGEPDANGTQHDVPGKALCRNCHENVRPSRVLGVSALQLDYDNTTVGEVDLADLVSMNMLSNPPAGASPYFPYDSTADSTVFPALGYLHANCSHCHNATSSVVTASSVNFRLTIDTVDSIATTPTYLTAVGATTPNIINTHNTLIYPNDDTMSVVMDRFRATDGNRMPALGSEFKDTAGDTILTNWINNIPP